MRAIQKVAAVWMLALAGVTGCAQMAQLGVTPSPATAVFAAKGGYEVALTAAVAYRNLPRCAPAVKPPCHDPAIVAQLQKAQPAARSTLDAAEDVVRAPGFGENIVATAVAAAQAALKAFTAITSTLQLK